MVKLEREIIFEADMRVTVYNIKKKMFSSDYNNIQIGEFRVPVSSMMK